MKMSAQQARKTKHLYPQNSLFKELKIIFKKIKILYSRFEVLPAVTTKIDVVSDVTGSSQVETDRVSKKRTVYIFGNKTASHFIRRKSYKEIPFQSREMY